MVAVVPDVILNILQCLSLCFFDLLFFLLLFWFQVRLQSVGKMQPHCTENLKCLKSEVV